MSQAYPTLKNAYASGPHAFRSIAADQAITPGISDKVYQTGRDKLQKGMDDFYVNQDLKEADKYDPETRVGGSYRDDS